MKYYELKKDYDISSTIKLTNTISYDARMDQDEFIKIPNLTINYFSKNQFMQYSDIITEPILLVSNPVKLVFELYDSHIKYKSIQIFAEDREDNTNFLYRWPYIKFLDCLSTNANIFPNGMVDKLVLDQQLIADNHIFYVKDILELKLIVSQALVESFLRRGLYGVIFEEVIIN